MVQHSDLYNGDMVIGNTSIESVESQSTQLLDFVLGRSEPPVAKTVDTTRTTVDEPNSPNLAPKSSGNTGDTSLSSADASVAGPYHFHGLARTQTQTHSLDSGGSLDSQKENASKSSVDTGNKLAEHRILRDLDAPSYILAPAQTTGTRTKSLPSHSLSSPAPPHPTKAVTFHPPPSDRPSINTLHKDQRDKMGFRSIPAPLTGHDSFGEPTTSQVEGQVIANSSIFSRPLDKLGEPDSQEEEDSFQKSSEGKPAVPTANMALSLSSGGGSRGYTLSTVASHGRILVADSDTSATSQDSNHLSQEATQILSATSTNFTNPNPESSNVHITSHEKVSGSDSSQEPTQILDELNVQATPAFGSTSINQSSTTDSAFGASRSLLNTLPPEKRGRYIRNFKDPNVSSTGTEAINKGPATVAPLKDFNSLPISAVTRDLLPPAQQGSIVSGAEKRDKGCTSMSSTQEEEEAEQEVIPPSESDMPDASHQSRLLEHASSETEEDVQAPAMQKSPSRRKPSRQPTTPKGRSSPAISDKEPDSGKPLAATRKSGKAAITAKAIAHVQAASAATPTLNKVTGSNSKARNTAKRGKANTKHQSPIPNHVVEPASETLAQRRPRALNLKEQNRHEKPASGASSKASAPNSKRPITRGGTPVPKPSLRNKRIPKQEKPTEEEETDLATELADDDVMSMDEEIMDSAKSTRKRKRPAPPGKNTRSKQVKQGIRATASAQRPPAKKRRISNSTTNTEVVAACFGAGKGTQVFALFKGDSCYYGAEVHSLSNGRAHIKYFDGLEDTSVGVAQLRRFELHEGDTVVPENFKAVVTDISSWATENEIRIRYIEGPDEDEEEVITADNFRIPSRSIQAQWKNRTIELSDIIPAVGKRLRDTPSPSKMSMMSAGKGSRYKVLSKYGFVLTLKLENNQWVQEKARLEAAVREGGGSVYFDWPNLFSMQGKTSYGNKRWTLAHEDIKFVLKDKSIDKVLLLSDQHNQKPRYLIALALGIPCVSAEWVYALLEGNDCHWSKYLLPAGCSEPLGGAKVSQMVDLAWGDVHECLTEITENKVPLKVLGGKSVLCVGTELFPPHSTKQAAAEQDKTRAASRNVPRIIAAMGANVEAVADIRYATHARELEQYDYIVRKDPSSLTDSEEGFPVVDVTWIKECLIAGRLLPIPDLTSD